MPEPRQFRVVSGRQLCRCTDHADFMYAAAQAAHFTYGFSIAQIAPFLHIESENQNSLWSDF